jgi:hypothetical protein
MHTLKVIAAGFALLAICLAVGRGLGGPGTASMVTAAKVFLPLWFIAAAVNLWIGVTRGGYSVADEAPIFAVVFGVPAAVAGLLWWRYAGS